MALQDIGSDISCPKGVSGPNCVYILCYFCLVKQIVFPDLRSTAGLVALKQSWLSHMMKM